MRSTKNLRERTTRAALSLRGLVRRLTVTATNAAGLWSLLGFDDERFQDVEAFGMGGVFGRPSTARDYDAIVVNVGAEPGHPVIVAVRDRALFASLSLDEDEWVFANAAGAKVHLKKNGDILVQAKTGGKVFIGDGSGGEEALVKKSEFDGHTHGPGTFVAGATPVTGTSAGAASVTGTTIARAK